MAQPSLTASPLLPEDNWPTPRSPYAIAYEDIRSGLAQPWMWWTLAMQDVRLRYRGSILGPFWFTVSTLIMCVAMGMLYSRLFNQTINEYIPYLLIGMVFWQFIQSTLADGCQTFTVVNTIIQQTALPFSIHAMRMLCKNVIALAHSIILYPFALVIFDVPLGWNTLAAIPGALLLFINSFFICMLFGAIGARFRDLQPIISNFIQVLFFVTPIFWSADALGRWKILAHFNPIYAAIDVIRAPLLGKEAHPESWLMMGAVTIFCAAASFLFFARFRSRIAYWV